MAVRTGRLPVADLPLTSTLDLSKHAHRDKNSIQQFPTLQSWPTIKQYWNGLKTL
jgi:hypothetical protein